MRRLRKVHISVSEDFYNLLNKHRIEYSSNVKKNTGINRDITLTNFTEIIARNKVIFPKIKINLFNNVKEQKSRRL